MLFAYCLLLIAIITDLEKYKRAILIMPRNLFKLFISVFYLLKFVQSVVILFETTDLTDLKLIITDIIGNINGGNILITILIKFISFFK